MVLTEQYFPRGGEKPKAFFNERKKFDFLGHSDKIGKKRKYRPRIEKEVVEKDLDHLSDVSDDEDDGHIKALNAEKLSNKTLQTGMVLLGRVSRITDMKLFISLPNRLYGSVMACNISRTYTELLQRYVDNGIEEISKLGDIFKIGEYVSVKVTSITEDNDKNIPTLSMLPQDVNFGMSFSNLREGDILRGSVVSKEDHGYVIDLGIPNCKSFLPSKFAEKNFDILVGQVLWCVVKKCSLSTTTNIVTLSNRIDMLKSARISGDKIANYTINDLRPGMSMDFFVNKPIQNGAEGYVLSNSLGYIHTSQIVSKLHTGKSIKVFLLYIMPITKLPFFTTREIFSTLNQDINEEIKYKEGQIIEDSKVSKVTPTAVIFKFDEGIGIMPKSMSKCSNDELKNEYIAGNEHKVRIIYYNFSDYAYICSDKENVLEQKYFSYDDFNVGEFVEAKVKEINDNGIFVKIDKLNGWIPNMLISDVGLYQSAKIDPKKPNIMTKFKVNQSITTRVWKVIPSKNLLHLTTKPTLLSSKLNVLSSYQDAEIGRRYKGVIEAITQHGIIVKFFNDVKAFIYRKELSHEEIKNIRDAFVIGQIVNCTVISVNPEEEKMSCSLIKTQFDNDSKEEKETKKSKKRSGSQNIEEEITSKRAKTCESSANTKKKNKKEETVTNESDVNNSDSNSSKNKKTKKDKKSKTKHDDEEIKPKKKDKPTKKKIHEKEVLICEDNEKNKSETDEILEDKCKFSNMKSFWNLDASTISKNIIGKSENDENSSSDDEVVEENIKKKKKRLTNSAKVEKARMEEEKLREVERKLMEANANPNSSDQFDRLLLANPNSSQLWIAYMAFHLQATEIDRARAIAKKAIDTISFREEQEKMNVWIALLNLENRFGTKESLNTTLQDAIQANDSFKIHSSMLEMYVETGKMKELTSLIETMLAKYKNIPEMYICIGEACYKTNMIEKARAVMQKAINRLENKKHVVVLIKFAQMEYANGDSERAETLFEQIVGCMPQRTDIWNIYVDILIKYQKIDSARLILERAISQKLSARKMKIMYKKWIDLEEKYGNTDSVEKVRQMAVKYVEGRMQEEV